MPTEGFQYANEGEMFSLGSKVNALCELTPETFDPSIHVDQAREIIEALSPRIKESSHVKIEASWTSRRRRSLRGATEHGEISISDKERARREKTFTRNHEYRIGNYVVRGTSSRISGNDTLTFVHFWKRGQGTRIDENPPSEFAITYKRKTNEPVSVIKYDYQTKVVKFRDGSFFSFAIPNRTRLWKARQ